VHTSNANNADTENALLSIQQVTKSFGGFKAVDRVSFDVSPGVICGLIGPNGAGKTTLFNTLAGHLKADSGGVYLAGKALHESAPHERFRAGLARTFQIPRPFGGMTVLENAMTVPLSQSGERFWNNWLSPRQVEQQEKALRKRAEEILDFCALGPVIGDLANTLSGGQLKLLELARVLMSEPKVILLDEPAAGINPTLMTTLVDRITALNKQGYTFLIIEHNMDVVMSICHPVIVMSQGQVIFQGDADGARQDEQVLDAYLGGLP